MEEYTELLDFSPHDHKSKKMLSINFLNIEFVLNKKNMVCFYKLNEGIGEVYVRIIPYVQRY